MTRLALLAALALLALPATALAKGHDGGLLLDWLSKPDGTRAGATWAARFAIVDRGGNRLLLGSAAHPEVRISGPSEQSFPAVDDGSGRYTAQVTFPATGDYVVEAVGFDPRDPERFIDAGPPVHIGAAAAPARATGG